MSRRCKQGQRARIITGTRNKGKIVLVVAPYFDGQEWDGSKNWAACIFPWKVVSLGGAIRVVDARTEEFLKDSLYCVIEDEELEPLEDDDDGLTRSTEKHKPQPRVKSKRKAVLHD